MCMFHTLVENCDSSKNRYTCIPWGDYDLQEGFASQIDYTCASINVTCSSVKIKRGLRIKSNHIPMSASFSVPEGRSEKVIEYTPRKSMAGFRFGSESDKQQLSNNVFFCLKLSGSSEDMCNMHVDSLRDLQEALDMSLDDKKGRTTGHRSRKRKLVPSELWLVNQRIIQAHGEDCAHLLKEKRFV